MAGRKPYDTDRLGGPPGLYDAPNRDRASDGGIIQRMRVPATPEAKDLVYPNGRFSTLSLNDSDSAVGVNGSFLEDEVAAAAQAKINQDVKETGVLYRKCITGDKI